MLDSLRALRMRHAFAFASVAVLAIGALVAMERLDGNGAPSRPVSPPPSVAVVAAPVAPGSGSAVSVFGIPTATAAPTITPGATTSPAAPLPMRRVRSPRSYEQVPITPAEGVFTQWGASVFSEEGMLQNDRAGKSVFHS